MPSPPQVPNSSSEPGLELWWCRWDGDGEGAAVDRFEVTDDMVERAALVCAHADGYEGSDVVPSDVYRHQARKVLASAFSTQEKPDA